MPIKGQEFPPESMAGAFAGAPVQTPAEIKGFRTLVGVGSAKRRRSVFAVRSATEHAFDQSSGILAENDDMHWHGD